MKKIILILLASFCFFIQLSAQSGEASYERRGHGTFFELGGAGFSYTFNYESRFFESNRGFGARVGLGFSSLKEVKCLTFPIHINYLLGKKDGKHYLEIGAGYTYVDLREMEDYKLNDETVYFEGTSFASFSLMYHKHPPLGGFLWKIGFTPLVGDFSDGRVFLPHFGLAFGYAF